MIAALTTLVAAKSRWGFWKCCDRLRNLGHPWNPKRLWRVYCQLRLNFPRRTRIGFQFACATAGRGAQLTTTWAVDFMRRHALWRRRFHTFNVLDEGVREGLAIGGYVVTGRRVIRVLEQVVAGADDHRRFGSTTYYRRNTSRPCEQFSPVPSERPLCTSRPTPNGLPRGVRRCSP